MPSRTILLLFFAVHPAFAQQITDTQRMDFADKAHAAYYSLPVRGMESMSCSVEPDWDTVPPSMKEQFDKLRLDRLDDAKLSLTLNAQGKLDLKEELPKGLTTGKTMPYSQSLHFYAQFVQGFFLTWVVKGFDGPIPWSQSGWTMQQTPTGYEFHIDNPSVVLTADTSYRVTRILSTFTDETIDERPVYTASPDGYLMTSDDAVTIQNNQKTTFHADITYQHIGALQFPETVHLKVNEDVDTTFKLTGCEAKTGTIVTVKPNNK